MNQELIKDYHFKKKFGQNFLKDENILRNIVEKSGVDKDTLVIEIGIGAAYLTYYLSKSAKNVIGYEIDESLKEIIDKQLVNVENVEIIYKDFLRANPINDISKYNYKKLYVVANLPYYITTPIITKLIEDKIPVEKIVVMVQKEVGDRFNAKPNSKEYNSLTIFLNYYFDIKKLMDVSRNCFVPKPNVDSAIIEFKKSSKYKVNNEDLFFKLVRDSFKFKRKNLKNNLKNYNLEKLEIALKGIKKDLTARAESLTIEDFIYISNNI
ncbi:MAG: ribosomal RNA small subunit methyltransferase A [Bacilli bacterium]|nr:ribosomal RNA small subunit methyltransferase A [Bacilli bacterium]